MSKNSNFTRERMIELLTEDAILECMCGGFFDRISYYLRYGFKGFEEMTDDELKDRLDDVLVEQVLESEKQDVFAEISI